MVARLQRHVGRAAAQTLTGVLLRDFESGDLGVVEQVVLVPALANHLPAQSRITQPTAGLGEVTPMPRRASSSARCIQ
jgi:hypothetical protein